MIFFGILRLQKQESQVLTRFQNKLPCIDLRDSLGVQEGITILSLLPVLIVVCAVYLLEHFVGSVDCRVAAYPLNEVGDSFQSPPAQYNCQHSFTPPPNFAEHASRFFFMPTWPSRSDSSIHSAVTGYGVEAGGESFLRTSSTLRYRASSCNPAQRIFEEMLIRLGNVPSPLTVLRILNRLCFPPLVR